MLNAASATIAQRTAAACVIFFISSPPGFPQDARRCDAPVMVAEPVILALDGEPMTLADANASGHRGTAKGANLPIWRTCMATLAIALGMTAPAAFAQHGAEANNMELVGFNDLQARSAYQPVIQNQNGRWIPYIWHLA